MFVAISDWPRLAVRGAAALVFGLITLAWPDITLRALVVLFGAYILGDGLFRLAAVVTGTPGTRGERGWLALAGIAGVLAGLLSFAWPGITALALLFLIAASAAANGVAELVTAVRLRRELDGEWLLGLVGVLSILFAVLLVTSPGAGALAVAWLIGSHAVVTGALVLILAVRLKRGQDQVREGSRSVPVG